MADGGDVAAGGVGVGVVVTAGMAVGAVADVADGGSKEDTGEADDGPQI